MALSITSKQKPVVVREVWASNVVSEFSLISRILPCYRHIAMDTEFPGVVYVHPEKNIHYSMVPPSHNYMIMKANVDALKPIQLGLALSNFAGNLPDLGTDSCYVWEFNFSDFDIDSDMHNPDSTRLLQSQGIDFSKNRAQGIPSHVFRRLFFNSGLAFNWMNMTWVTFHGYYDFGYLVKILTQRKLPNSLASFKFLVRDLFGLHVYDLKHMTKFFYGLNGGLEKLAKILKVDRVAGKGHQAGSDSLLTLQTFIEFRDVYFSGDGDEDCITINMLEGALYGL